MKKLSSEDIALIIMVIVGVVFAIGCFLPIFIRMAKDLWQWALM